MAATIVYTSFLGVLYVVRKSMRIYKQKSQPVKSS